VHIHGRKPDCPWQCTDDPAVYAEINAKIQAKCPGMIVNNTTGGGITTTMEDRLRCLDARPEIASLNLGPDMSRFTLRERPAPLPSPHEKIDVDDCLPFTYGMIDKLAEKMKKNGIKPEMELYHEGQYWVVRELIAKKLIEPPYMIQFIMGYQTSAYPTLDNVIHLARALPKESVFSVAGIGKYQWHMITMAILMGGHVRVGLEDNLYERKGEFLKSNAHAVEKVVRIAKELGRPIATPAQAREILGLPEMPTGCGHD